MLLPMLLSALLAMVAVMTTMVYIVVYYIRFRVVHSKKGVFCSIYRYFEMISSRCQTYSRRKVFFSHIDIVDSA